MNWALYFPVWREILLILIVIIVLYMVWLVWKMRGLNRAKPPPCPLSSGTTRDEPTLGVSAKISSKAPSSSKSAKPKSARSAVEDDPPLVYSKPSSLLSNLGTRLSSLTAGDMISPPGVAGGDFGQKIVLDGVSRELKETREEVETLRDSFTSLRGEMEMLRARLKNAQTVQTASPLYKEATHMAILGHDALTISERCGISRAEAELVISLMKNKDGKTS